MDSTAATMQPGRRLFLGGAVATLGFSTLWAEVVRAGDPEPTDALRLVDIVSDLTIPTTKVPGARAAGVPAFLLLAIAHHTLGATGDEPARLRAELDRQAGGDFLALSAARQFTALQAVDAASLPPRAGTTSAWPVVKSLILAGYYSSEAGGAHDQMYELVPGRFDSDIPHHPGDPALSNDWAGVAFR